MTLRAKCSPKLPSLAQGIALSVWTVFSLVRAVFTIRGTQDILQLSLMRKRTDARSELPTASGGQI
jgi:hypothetical protein